jgi:hypothetical protein
MDMNCTTNKLIYISTNISAGFCGKKANNCHGIHITCFIANSGKRAVAQRLETGSEAEPSPN